MSILLTGGAGYIGSHTSVAMQLAGRDVLLADNFCNSSPRVLERLEKITGKRPRCIEADMCDRAAVEKIFRENDITGVIHFAGLKAVGESVAKPLLYYRTNLDSAMTVLETMTRFGCHEFVFSSSATVYGDQPAPLTESAKTGSCSNPYGWTKFMIEQILMGACKADPSLSVVLLRYFNPVGAHPGGTIGEDPRGIPNNLMPYVTQVAVGKRAQLSVYGGDYDTPDGTGVRDYIHVMDLAEGHVAAIDYADSPQGLRDLQPRHRRRLQRARHGQDLLRGQRRARPLCDRPAPRGRPRHRLRRPRQGEKRPRLAGQTHPRRHVPRLLALAERQPLGLLR
jgi:UDP-glucose 4-epimerase